MSLLKCVNASPPDNGSAKDWFLYKNQVLTESMRIFRERHPWFQFKKQDMFFNLGGVCNIPKVNFVLQKSEDVGKVLRALNNERTIVFKKTVGHSGREVHILCRPGKNKYIDCLLTKISISVENLQEWVNESECIVEESLSSFEEPIPLDFKCYLVGGKVKYLAIINRNSVKPIICYLCAENLNKIYFEEIFSDPPRVWIEGFGDVSEVTKNRARLAIGEAERVAHNYLNVQDIIISLDMYVTSSGEGYKTWLGEITPRPGALHSNWLKRQFILDLFEIEASNAG